MFLDASAIVAILTREPEAEALADTLDTATAPLTSPIALFEAVRGLRRKRHASIAEAQTDVLELLSAAALTMVDISVRDAATAMDAFSRYGKGSGHPAQRNLGDCFAYAAARNAGTSLMFKGDDVTKTDISPVQ